VRENPNSAEAPETPWNLFAGALILPRFQLRDHRDTFATSANSRVTSRHFSRLTGLLFTFRRLGIPVEFIETPQNP
jgi:hypothetical protein